MENVGACVYQMKRQFEMLQKKYNKLMLTSKYLTMNEFFNNFDRIFKLESVVSFPVIES